MFPDLEKEKIADDSDQLIITNDFMYCSLNHWLLFEDFMTHYITHLDYHDDDQFFYLHDRLKIRVIKGLLGNLRPTWFHECPFVSWSITISQ